MHQSANNTSRGFKAVFRRSSLTQGGRRKDQLSPIGCSQLCRYVPAISVDWYPLLLTAPGTKLLLEDKVTFKYIRSQNSTVSSAKSRKCWHLGLSFNGSTSSFESNLSLHNHLVPSNLPSYNNPLLYVQSLSATLIYHPLTTWSCSFDNLIGFYCRTPVTLHKVQWWKENILRKMLIGEKFEKKKTFFSSLLRKWLPSATHKTALASSSFTTFTQTRLHKKTNITRDFFTFNEKAKKCIKSYLQSCFFIYFFMGLIEF